jgi:hypothetical protein
MQFFYLDSTKSYAWKKIKIKPLKQDNKQLYWVVPKGFNHPKSGIVHSWPW